MISKTDLAYAAGIIDGEGCIHVGRRKSKRAPQKYVAYTLHIIVTMNDESIIKFLQRIFGGAVRYTAKKNVWSWEAVSVVAESALKSVMPWLIGKKPQAELALRFRKLAMPPGHRPPADNESLREKIYWKMRELKTHSA